MANFVAQGISRKQIRAFTKYVRELCGMTDRLYFPVVEFLEIILLIKIFGIFVVPQMLFFQTPS